MWFWVIGMVLQICDLLLQVDDEHVVGHDGGHGQVLAGGELLVGEKVEGIRRHAQVRPPPDEILVIEGGGAPAVVMVEFEVVVEIDLEPVDLGIEVLDLELGAAARPLALDAVQLTVVDELAEYLGLDVLEEVNLVPFGREALVHDFTSEHLDAPLGMLDARFRLL